MSYGKLAKFIRYCNNEVYSTTVWGVVKLPTFSDELWAKTILDRRTADNNGGVWAATQSVTRYIRQALRRERALLSQPAKV